VVIKLYNDIINDKVGLQKYKQENQFYKAIFELKPKGFPLFQANGSHKKNKKYIIMTKHGYDLHTIHKICN